MEFIWDNPDFACGSAIPSHQKIASSHPHPGEQPRPPNFASVFQHIVEDVCPVPYKLALY